MKGLVQTFYACMCRGVAPRAVSDGINSAVFFCFFGILRNAFKQRQEAAQRAKAQAVSAKQSGKVTRPESHGLVKSAGRPIMQPAV